MPSAIRHSPTMGLLSTPLRKTLHLDTKVAAGENVRASYRPALSPNGCSAEVGSVAVVGLIRCQRDFERQYERPLCFLESTES
jgi:hypothetical protein